MNNNEQSKQTNMPNIRVDFAPTNAFIDTYGKEEAEEQAQRFTEPTWQQNLTAKRGRGGSDDEEARDIKERMQRLADEMDDRRRAVVILLGGVFVAGVVCGFFLHKHLFIE